jgi:hypothetical protein
MKFTVTKGEWLSKVFGAICFLALLSSPIRAFSAAPSAPYSLTLAWSRNSSHSPEVAGYRVYYGTASKKYTGNIAVGNVATYVVPGLTSGVTYFFAITAYNTNGLESGLSKEFHYVLKSSKASKTLFPHSMNVPGEMSVVPELPAAQIYAAASLSPEIPAVVIVPPAVRIRMASNKQFILTVSGQTGHTYYVMATQTFADWTVIGTVTPDASGSLDFTDTNSANFPQRFYRISDSQP